MTAEPQPEERIDALVVGAGPAGLMAAEALAARGRSVVVADAKPSPARKFLMAGKSGLNLTYAEDRDRFLTRYGAARDRLAPIVGAFDAAAVQDWARGLGQDVFVGSSGRVFPMMMKASPLLRAWLARLDAAGVVLNRSWRWLGWDGDACRFATPEGAARLRPSVTVLALGGASWPRLGSDGAWTAALARAGVPLAPFWAANAGIAVDWSDKMAPRFGQPVKGTRLTAGATSTRGEFMVSRGGLEGSGVYAISQAVREGAELHVDLAPDLAAGSLADRLGRARGKATELAHLRKRLGLSPVKIALLHEFGRPLPEGAALAALVKRLPIRHQGLRPLEEAISTAGGVRWEAVDKTLMLNSRPGTFVAGEMLDWEAPTGGYLLTACLATGRWAGRHAADRSA